MCNFQRVKTYQSVPCRQIDWHGSHATSLIKRNLNDSHHEVNKVQNFITWVLNDCTGHAVETEQCSTNNKNYGSEKSLADFSE